MPTSVFLRRPESIGRFASGSYTTDFLERPLVEERRRRKIIPNAFVEKLVLKLMFGAMIRAAERWRTIKVSELERRQIRAVRKEIDREN